MEWVDALLSFPLTILSILVIIIAIAVIIWAAHSWQDRQRFTKFKEAMTAAFRIPQLFGYEEGQCFVCRANVNRDQSQAQVVWVSANKLRILSASDPSNAEIYLPAREGSEIAHLSCVSGHLARRIEGGGHLFSNMNQTGSTRYVAFHDFNTEKYYWGFFPQGWRPGDNYPSLPFSITQPEILVEYLLAKARVR
jgi:hypothetical protein